MLIQQAQQHHVINLSHKNTFLQHSGVPGGLIFSPQHKPAPPGCGSRSPSPALRDDCLPWRLSPAFMLSCSFPRRPDFGDVTVMDLHSGGVAHFHCHLGYELQGAKTLTCINASKPHWSSREPICSGTHRPQPDLPWMVSQEKRDHPPGGQRGSLVAQSCPTLCDPTGCSLPGFSVLGILQASILEWVAMPSSRRSSQPGSHTLQAEALLSEPQGKPMVLRLTLGKRLIQKCGDCQFCYMIEIHVT